MLRTGTIVDATMIHAPSSTRNAKKERDPAMRQTRKGKQWYFGLKAHIGVDAKEGHVHSVATSAANVSDVPMLPDLLHGGERKVWGDGGHPRVPVPGWVSTLLMPWSCGRSATCWQR